MKTVKSGPIGMFRNSINSASVLSDVILWVSQTCLVWYPSSDNLQNSAVWQPTVYRAAREIGSKPAPTLVGKILYTAGQEAQCVHEQRNDIDEIQELLWATEEHCFRALLILGS